MPEKTFDRGAFVDVPVLNIERTANGGFILSRAGATNNHPTLTEANVMAFSNVGDMLDFLCDEYEPDEEGEAVPGQEFKREWFEETKPDSPFALNLEPRIVNVWQVSFPPKAEDPDSPDTQTTAPETASFKPHAVDFAALEARLKGFIQREIELSQASWEERNL